MSTYRRILRAADISHPYWVALLEDKCTGQNFHMLRGFCEQRGLSLSWHGHSVTHRSQYYQIFMFRRGRPRRHLLQRVRRRTHAPVGEGYGSYSV